MANPNNNACFIGRLGADPKVFTNKDGSATVKITLYAQNNFKNSDQTVGTVRASFKTFVSKEKMANGLGVYGRIHKGDLISVLYEIRNNDYTRPDGTKVYSEVKQITSLTMNESRQITEQRQANRAATAAAAEAAAMAKQQNHTESMSA